VIIIDTYEGFLRRLFVFFMAIFWGIGCLWGGECRYVTLSTVKVRPLAMGGAFVSVWDDLASLDFNPATFSVTPHQYGVRYGVFFNALGPILLVENRETASVFQTAPGWLIRGAYLSFGRFQAGILLGEESLGDTDRLTRLRVFSDSGYTDHRNASFGFSLALAQRVSFGVAGEVFMRRSEDKSQLALRYRYGLLVKPRDNLNVGICFVDLPKSYQNDRMPLERLADETLNIGISYAPWRALCLALDVRNVSDEGQGAAIEPHLGFDVVPWTHLAIRGGYYREWETQTDVYSVGIGLLDWNSMLSEFRRFSHPTFTVNAAMIWEVEKGRTIRWLLLNGILRL
jgi:hypothetical protein